jgi:Uma2 family endonuclease
MNTVVTLIPRLAPGDKLSQKEFLRRWEAMPHVKRAELIGGFVYMPSPLSANHGNEDVKVTTWAGTYAAFTKGCRALANATWLMLGDAPQPDVALFILPEYGGRTRTRHGLASGAPELAAEVSLSSSSYDLHQKLELYRRAGVKEYLTVLAEEQEVRWHRLVRRRYRVQPIPADGILRSQVFAGLWLNVPALVGDDLAGMLATLQQGLASPEHEEFVERLARKKKR